MSRETDCRQAEDRMDAARTRDLTDGERDELRAHLDVCEDCRASARLREELRPFVEASEDDMPAGLTADMWAGVEGRLPTDQSRRHPAAASEETVVPLHAGRRIDESAPGRQRWWNAPRLVPALAATVAVLLLGLGLLAGQVRDLQHREDRLASQLDRQEQLIRDLRLRQETPAAGRAPARTGLAELSALTRGGEATVGEFLRLLDELPPERELLSSREAQTLMRRVTAAVGESVAGGLPRIETADGLQAGEAVNLLAAFPLDPDQKISRTRLRVMSRGLGL